MTGPRRFAGRLARTLALAVTVALVVAAVGHRAADPAGALPTVRVVNTATAGAGWTPQQPLYVLLLGDDRRPGGGCGCSDAIHVVGIPAGGGQATMINIPRDTRVNVPGRGTTKINSALSDGGPELAAQTVSGFVGVPITYTFVVNFESLPALVDDIGGVVVDVPYRILDTASGANVDEGPMAMDGQMALAFARARKAVAGGDFGRTTNQGLLIIGALGTLRTNGTGASDQIRYLGALVRHVRADGIGAPDLYRLGRLALGIDPAAVRNYTMPAGTGTIGGTSYVLAGDAATTLFADFADDAILQSH